MKKSDNQSKTNGCMDKCDEKFIDCVNSWRQDCLDRFGSCSSNCKIG